MTDDSSRAKPMPAFYCCYLLRSSKKSDCMYIGSTPNPARRLEQHNGISRGGAKRTTAQTLRPWQMVAIVEGFTSRTGALQFEWSWQNVHKCRHIDIVESDILNRTNHQAKVNSGSNKRSGASKSLAKNLGNLHQLLRSDYFRTWPLVVRFLSADAYGHWQRWTERVDGLLPDNMHIKLDLQAEGVSFLNPHLPANDMAHIDASYNGMKEYLEKSLFLLDDSNLVLCEVCKKRLSVQSDVIVVCSHPNCRAASHLVCLSRLFLEQDGSTELVPTIGDCPACNRENRWAELIKEVTLRLRGGDTITSLFKTKRIRKTNASNKKTCKGDEKLTEAVDNILDRDYVVDDDDGFDENWIDAVDVASDQETIEHAIAKPKEKTTSRIEIVIEDSEAEDSDIFD
ncbi:structure-specific endonuclease subunit slx1 [Talaromyces proteolyticus]|uniref:Structure-specific endonuclease subunit slx1 n=1 Tax=Talaromyces proteolyticus TaxID=1131652 RepID=A0AAD4KX52_9EURO|nr:structure-specific endonuclease subunit slx1 [Talaromyces proteolyticus]KAH8702114.1 structure-specific endonuclease subunit slx1 [Talaromyces proteolyticus]